MMETESLKILCYLCSLLGSNGNKLNIIVGICQFPAFLTRPQESPTCHTDLSIPVETVSPPRRRAGVQSTDCRVYYKASGWKLQVKRASFALVPSFCRLYVGVDYLQIRCE